ncbi:alcohol oxidase [Trametes versicolor FP-101664 SS1]|uniref:alcohol oxidase n=1 Tax=Trametes versicolor (strain FP-101664) TaxID=717944 RepID=UPI00046214ED|nr:alcohol oxidase [Trametes versicolor FP-101664 SS1]EIW56999.1 alcohol oxidase [Trametes versicolor FP-101664 SS1]
MPIVPELRPQDVGTPLPINPAVPVETYTYDYIVVGGGTAGCVLASRLSEDPSVSVLLVEQGPVADTWASRIPLISGNPYRNGTLAATWWSQPMPQLDGRAIQVMRGEALGGTSRINALLYTRGPPGDYNRWKELGCDGWGYADLEPYFAKSEETLSHPGSQFRGTKGPWVNRQWKTYPYKIVDKVIPALESANIPWADDLNNPAASAAVMGALDVIQDKGFRRASTYHAFLPGNLAQDRKARLKICTNTIVTRLDLADEDGTVRARGVHIAATNPRKAQCTYYAKARREVVLSAGALGSPQILMLSGIGPRGHLEEKNVPVVLDMPAVGNHLQDHIGVPLTYQVPMSDSLHQLENSIFSALKAAFTYVVTGRGLFSSPFQSITSLIPTRLLDDHTGRIVAPDPSALDASISANRPDLELMPLANNCTDADIPGKGVFTLLPTLVLPKSQGRVRLASNNPRARPDIELGFFTDQADYLPLRKGVRLALRVAEEIRRTGYPLQELIVPDGDGDSDIDAFIRKNLRDCFHYTSTCHMGAEAHGSQPSVVDTALRVHGTRGLRVCDTSVFPEVVATHTMAPAVVVAEKCAALMRAAAKV